MPLVRVDVESDLWLPDWVLRAKAKERVKVMMEHQNLTGSSITMRQVRRMNPNDKVPGVVAVPPAPGTKQDFLFIPSLGTMSRDEVTYLIGCYRGGGYGKGPQHRSSAVDWERTVKNTVDYLVETRKKKAGKVWL